MQHTQGKVKTLYFLYVSQHTAEKLYQVPRVRYTGLRTSNALRTSGAIREILLPELYSLTGSFLTIELPVQVRLTNKFMSIDCRL
jgi:hypothetical protein